VPLPSISTTTALPPINTTAAPSLPGVYSTFKEAVTAGANAAQGKRWQDSLSAFNAALPLAQTDQEKSYAGKWIHYVNGQMGASTPPLPARQAVSPAAAPNGAPAQTTGSALPGYKGLKWGATLAEFKKVKKYRNKIKKDENSQGFGTDKGMSMPIDLLLSNFKGAPEADLLNIYLKKDDVYYLFYKGCFFMVSGLLENENYPDILSDFKTKYTFVKNFKNSSQDYSGQNTNVEYSEFESADGVLEFLIKNTRDYSGEIFVNTFFVYVPKDKLEEIQNTALEKIRKNESGKKNQKEEKLKRDKNKL
jgi:hypothetical protein